MTKITSKLRAHSDHFYTGDVDLGQLAILDIVIGQNYLDDCFNLLVIVLLSRLPDQLVKRVQAGLEDCPVLQRFLLLLEDSFEIFGQVAYDLGEGEEFCDAFGQGQE